MKKVVRVVFFLFISFTLNICFAEKLPTILIIGTGGTIAGKGSSSTSGVYCSGQIKIEDLIANVPKLDKFAVLKFKQLLNIDSRDMSIANLLAISETVNTALSDKSIDGVVITHGTDTIEETAYFLNLTVKSNKPVIITGSMRPATSISADGPVNLFNAVAVAACADSAGKGVLLVFNDNIFDARNVAKTSTSNIDAFSSPNGGAIGSVIMGNIDYYYQPLKKHTTKTPFNVKGMASLPRVIILTDYSGSSSDILEKAIDCGVKGITYAGTGNGSINKTSWKALEKARKKGIIIVRSSRIGSGSITFDSLDSLDTKLGLIPADNMSPQKARFLLMLALTKTHDIKVIREYFKTF